MANKESTVTYQWPDGVIRRIDVRTQKNGFAVAYIHADDSEDQRATRASVRAAIREKGWGTLSDSRDGAYVLRVAGLRSGAELIDALREKNFITTDPIIGVLDDGKEESKGIVASVKSRSLRWSGILASVGNAFSIAEGVLRSFEDMARAKSKGKKPEFDYGQTGMGLAFAMADLPLALVDEHDNSRQLNLLLKKLVQEYEHNGIVIPQKASIYVETSDKGKTFGERTFDFIHAYANQIKCGLEVVASGFSIKAGLKQGNNGKVMAGAIFGPGFLASLLIPEKKIDEEKYEKAGVLGKFWMRVQSNPLSVGGLLGYSNTIFTYYSAHDEGQRLAGNRPPKINKSTGEVIEPSKYYKMDYGIPTIMIGANGLYAMSKKTVGGDIKSDPMVQDAYRIASQIINKQPDGELREKAIETTARFFAQRMEIKEHYPEARARLIAELDSQRQNPWFELQGIPPYTPTPKKHGIIRSHDTSAAAPSHIAPLPAPNPNAPAPTPAEPPANLVTAADSVHAGQLSAAPEHEHAHA